jgi:hypothetical protein
LRRCKACGRKFTPRHQETRLVQVVHRKLARPRRPAPTESLGGKDRSDEDEWSKLSEDGHPPGADDEPDQAITL